MILIQLVSKILKISDVEMCYLEITKRKGGERIIIIKTPKVEIKKISDLAQKYFESGSVITANEIDDIVFNKVVRNEDLESNINILDEELNWYLDIKSYNRFRGRVKE